MASQGVLTKNSFDTSNGDFTGEFILDSSINAPSVLYANTGYYYASGFTFALKDAQGIELNASDYALSYPSDNYIQFQINNSSFNEQKITVSLQTQTAKQFLQLSD